VDDVYYQLYGDEEVKLDNPSKNNGFLKYSYHPDEWKQTAMIFAEDNVPVLAQLAKKYVVFNEWYSSLPGPTLPNRSFILSGRSTGYKNSQCLFMKQHTIFDGPPSFTWTVYFHDLSTTALMFNHKSHLLDRNKYAHFQKFIEDAKNNKLPMLTFIEPRYLNWGDNIANDQHPPHSVTEGERLIAEIYNNLYVENTSNNDVAFLITYDEHGGFYDHKSPPWLLPKHFTNINDDTKLAFYRYGVRVPTILISPFLSHQIISHQMDHCSIPRTIKQMFDFEQNRFTSRVTDATNFLEKLKWNSVPMEAKRITLPSSKDIPANLKMENYYFPKSWMQSALIFLKENILGGVNNRIKGMKNDTKTNIEEFMELWEFFSNKKTD